MSEARKLTGKVPAEAIVRFDLPELAPGIIEGFQKLSDLAGTISDAMDELGIVGAVPSSVLKPTLPSARLVGPALTIRNIPQTTQAYKGAKERVSKMAEIEGHNLAKPGDVLVIEGVEGISSMGGLSASIAKRQGEAGAVVDGSVRDVEHSQGIGFPIWSRGVSPITGKWRLETVAINGPVKIAGIQVHPGDLVVADSTGVCFVPRAQAAAVLARAQQIDAGEARRYQDIDAGVPVPELAKKTYVYKFDS
jgi:regulator of RNase E activity RraA